MEVEDTDLGRYVISNAEVEKGAFKTPTVRNVVFSPVVYGATAMYLDARKWVTLRRDPGKQVPRTTVLLALATNAKHKAALLATPVVLGDDIRH